jgi:sodium/bile acid cotransporter 7
MTAWWAKIDRFLLAMLVAVIAALVWPAPGKDGGFLHLDLVTPFGIALVFFLHGVFLSPAAMKAGAAKWRLHLAVQATTFVLFPILGGFLYWATAGFLPIGSRVGVYFLCAVPSTIASSVAMTAMARGDVPSAVVNASASGLIGMIVTPLLMQAIDVAGGQPIALMPAITGILLTLGLPFALGQALRSLIIARLAPHKSKVSALDRLTILLIVYSAFCETTASGLWHQVSPWQLLATGAIAFGVLIVMLGFTGVLARAMGLTRAERATLIFCGSKKSLASGAPMAKVMFAGDPHAGLIQLPLILYHQIQLVVCTMLASRMAREAAAPERGGSNP